MGCLFGRPESSEHRPHQHSSAKTLGDLVIFPGQFIKASSGSYRKQYKVIRLLGSGAFGKVYEVEHTQSKLQRAVKEIEKAKAISTDGDRTEFIKEVDILSKLDHPNVMKVYELFEDEYKYAVVSEFVSGGELFEYVIRQRRLTEPLAATVMSQLLSALQYLHQNGIVHRDLKPENILLEKTPTSNADLNIKIIDFGASATRKNELHQTIGTAFYMAPEVFRHNYNEKCDVWSAGVIMYILLTGKMPFTGDDEMTIMDNVLNSEAEFPKAEWDTVSQEGKELVRLMLSKDPKTRPSAENALKSPWFTRAAARVDAAEVGQAIDDLRKFRGDVKLKQAVATFITTQVLSKEETQRLTDVFSSIDTNHDGLLSKSELLTGLSKSMSPDEATARVDEMMTQIDMDKSGSISYTEFIAASASVGTQMSREVLKKTFEMIDVDGSGKIGIGELKSLLGQDVIGKEAVWLQLLEQADKNGDGQIDIQEFTDMMVSTYS